MAAEHCITSHRKTRAHTHRIKKLNTLDVPTHSMSKRMHSWQRALILLLYMGIRGLYWIVIKWAFADENYTMT